MTKLRKMAKYYMFRENDDIVFLGETDIDVIQDAILQINPKLVIIDSIQTMYSDEITSGPRKC